MAGLGRRTWTAGEVVTAANVQGYLQDQSVMVFASVAARTAAIATPTEGMVSYLSDTKGMDVYDGAAWKRIADTGASIIQVVTATTNTAVTNTTATYADTGLTATITPFSTTSKILVLVSQSVQPVTGTNTYAAGFQLLRGATSINETLLSANAAIGGGGALSVKTNVPIIHFDSPATTSATIYKTQAYIAAGGTRVVSQEASARSNITLIEVAA